MSYPVLIVSVLLLLASVSLAHNASARIVPEPKSIELRTSPPWEMGKVAIVLGERATDVEKYAGDMFEKCVLRRFGLEIPMVKEDAPLENYDVLIVLGQQGSCSLTDHLSDEWKVELPQERPGQDPYLISMREQDDKKTVLLLGSNPRSLIYAQDTLFQLLQEVDGKLSLTVAEIVDWGSVTWRGRPQTSPDPQLRPGVMDSYARARVNWTDLRDSDMNKRGQYGYPPQFPFNKEDAQNVLNEAHKRGLFTYATVNCSVSPEHFDAAVEMFQEFIDMGVDGLYISHDDPGAPYRFGSPIELVERVVELGRQHGMTDHAIAIVPGKKSYGNVLTDVNRAVAAVPGMENALWYFTTLPSEENTANGNSIGLRRSPAWWHNWPRIDGRFLYSTFDDESL